MKIKELFCTFAFTIFLLTSCNGQNDSKTSFEKEAVRVVEQVGNENIKHQKELIEGISFSNGVREVVEWFDYETPLMQEYNPKRVKSIIEYNNLLEDFNSIDNLKALHLNFSSNGKEGDIIDLKGIENLQRLEYLELTNIETVPTNLYELKNLRVLICSFAELDSINGLTKLKKLEHLELKFSDDVLPNSITELNNLKTLRLNNFSKNQPFNEIYKLTNLETLWLKYSDSTQLKGISKLSNLKTFVSNMVSSELSDVKSLRGLIIFNNNDLDYPNSLGKLKQLVAFKLQTNYEIVTAPEFVSNLENLEYIEIRGCSKLTDIPSSYNHLKNLKRFDIYYNKSFNEMPNNLEDILSVIDLKTH
ncbi:hypothetical protein [uncultured Aquimarina sp.]|uniref:leucine-rich repeat domain-containing protein n=1 Tax=uncultured Aquimarina sp. TaxID=575652 RepID=UPI00261D2FF0|nr:hypothetical protein [uncultured Aquimarina sp.]